MFLEMIDLRIFAYLFVFMQLTYLLIFVVAEIKNNQLYMKLVCTSLLTSMFGYFFISIHVKSYGYLLFFGDTLLIAGLILLILAIAELINVYKAKKVFLIFLVLHTLANFYFANLKPDFFIRTTIFSIEAFLLCMYLTLILIYYFIKTKYNILLFPILLSSGMGIFHLVRVTALMYNIGVVDLFSDEVMTKYLFIDSFIFNTGMYTSVILLASKIFTEKLRIKRNHLEMLTTEDYLTKAYNMRSFTKKLMYELKKIKALNKKLSIAIIDLDNFKTINDTFGHLKGDEVLEKFAKIFKNNIRKSDIFGRYGGEEFLIVFPSLELKRSKEILENIQNSLEKTDWFPDELKVRFSAGLMEIDSNNDNINNYQAILKEIDKLLYKAKENGKNRIETH